MQVTQGRTPTHMASSKTLKRRRRELQSVRELVSKGGSSVLLRNEVEYLNDAERMTLLQQVGVVAQISARQALAIKAGLGIPWTKLRILRR